MWRSVLAAVAAATLVLLIVAIVWVGVSRREQWAALAVMWCMAVFFGFACFFLFCDENRQYQIRVDREMIDYSVYGPFGLRHERLLREEIAGIQVQDGDDGEHSQLIVVRRSQGRIDLLGLLRPKDVVHEFAAVIARVLGFEEPASGD